MSKFLLNLLVQISKALVYSKIKFYSEKNFPRHFRPIRPSHDPLSFFSNRPIFPRLPQWASAPRPAQPTRATLRVDPDTSTERKENGRINPLHCPITRRGFPLFNNR
jgi:hypothetical protein